MPVSCDLEFVIGLMKQNTDALGFIPETTVDQRYIRQGRFIIQKRNGNPVGYVLHGKPTAGGVLSIAQAVIDYDFRQRGHGMDAISTLIDRAKAVNCRAIKLRCADDLQANSFWQQIGFELCRVDSPSNRRRRRINTYMMDLWPTLWHANGE